MPITASYCFRSEEYNLKAHRLGPCSHGPWSTGEDTEPEWLQSLSQFTQLYVKVPEFHHELYGSKALALLIEFQY